MLLLATAQESGIERPVDLFSLGIPHFKESFAIHGQWGPEIIEIPIFRCQVNGYICDPTPWHPRTST